MNKNVRQINLAMIMLLLLATASCVHVGQRLLTIWIEVDGEIAFEGIQGVPDDTPIEKMWNVLGDVPLEPRSDSGSVSDETGRQTCLLEGNIVVRISHADRELAIVSLPSLWLQKDTAGTIWSLERKEIERIKQARRE